MSKSRVFEDTTKGVIRAHQAWKEALLAYRNEIKTVIKGTIAGYAMSHNAQQHLREGINMVEKQLQEQLQASIDKKIRETRHDIQH